MEDEPRRPGRPSFRPTPAQRSLVESAAMAGSSQDDIAKIVGIDRNTLTKHFPEELRIGSLHMLVHSIDQLRKAAKKGNVSAQKKLIDMAQSLLAEQDMAKAEVLRDGKSKFGQKLGKKEQAQMDARTAGEGTEWERYLRDDDTPSQERPN